MYYNKEFSLSDKCIETASEASKTRQSNHPSTSNRQSHLALDCSLAQCHNIPIKPIRFYAIKWWCVRDTGALATPEKCIPYTFDIFVYLRSISAWHKTFHARYKDHNHVFRCRHRHHIALSGTQ